MSHRLLSSAFATSLVFSAFVLVGCGSSDSSPSPQTSGDGGSTSTGSTGSTGTSSSDETSCVFPKNTLNSMSTVCEEVTGSEGQEITTACNAVNGTLGTKCPTAHLLGCCAGICYYDDDEKSAAEEQKDCTNDGHTWSTTP